MSFQIIGTRGVIPFKLSEDDIRLSIERHASFYEIQWTDYLLDASGDIRGLKGMADLGHGYGFDFGWKEFTIKLSEEYTFTHSYTSINGPSDWSDDSFEVTLRMIAAE